MTTESQSPTVILVHGAFADASSWARVSSACGTPGSRPRRSRTRSAG